MLLNKYKYSLNRGLNIRTEMIKKGANIKSYAIVSQSSPVLYDISINQHKDMLVLYNEHQYLHRKCTYVGESNQQVLNQASEHYKSDKNSFTVIIANQSTKSQQMIMGKDVQNSLLNQTLKNFISKKNEKSSIVLSVVGVCSQNTLTDQLCQQLTANDDFRSVLRLRNNPNSFNRFQLENLTKKTIRTKQDLQQVLTEYTQIKNQKECLSISSEKNWDWLQGELFIMTQIGEKNQFGDQPVLRSHYILKINQYLQTSSSLMLKLGIFLRKLKESHKRVVQTNEAKLFKLISNCWPSNEVQNIHTFIQIGHHLTLKQEYLSLVSISDITPTNGNSGQVFSQLSFCYIKGYENYPKITSFVSRLNKENTQIEEVNRIKQKSFPQENVQYSEVRIGVKPYARDTFSSIEKKRVNSIQMEFEEAQSDQNKNLDAIIQEATNLYKQSQRDYFRFSYMKKSNNQVLRRHKKIVDEFSNVSKLPTEFYRSERMRQKQISTMNQSITGKMQRKVVKSEQKESINFKQSNLESAFEIYTKNKKSVSRRQYNSRKQKRKVQDFVQHMVKKEILELERDEDIFFYDESHKQVY